MRLEGFKAGSKRFRMPWAAALVLPVAVGFAAPAAADPEFAQSDAVTASAGETINFPVRGAFQNAGTNPKYTSGTVDSADYVRAHGIFEEESADDTFFVEVKTAEELNALDSSPSSPFTFTATVAMTNDEGETASGTISFSVTYTQTSGSAPAGPPAWSASATETIAADAGEQIIFFVGDLFDNAGTNPRFTSIGGPTTHIASRDYYPDRQASESDRFYVRFMTAAQLNALSPRPPSPAAAEAAVTMTNDEGQTASGTLTFSVTYTRTATQTDTGTTTQGGSGADQ